MSGTPLHVKIGACERVFLDSVSVIYFIEGHASYLSIIKPVFQMVDRGLIAGLSSHITLLEVLTQPLRLGKTALAEQYRKTLTTSPNFTLFPIEETVAAKAAAIRAQYNFKPADSIQLATAELRSAEIFITNDKGLRRFTGVEVLVLDDYLPT